MVGWGEPDFHIKGLHDFLPQIGNKSVPVVGHRHDRRPEAARPLQETLGALGGRGGLHGVGFQPS